MQFSLFFFIYIVSHEHDLNKEDKGFGISFTFCSQDIIFEALCLGFIVKFILYGLWFRSQSRLLKY